MNQKLDKILATLEKITERMGKFEANSAKLLELDNRLTSKCEKLEEQFENFAKLSELDTLKARLNSSENSVDSATNKFKNVSG